VRPLPTDGRPATYSARPPGVVVGWGKNGWAVRRRDQDGRPAIELIGEDESTGDASARVELGRPAARRGKVVVGAAAVAVLLAGGLALGDEDGDDTGSPSEEGIDPNSTTSTSAKPASTTSLLGPAAAPVFGAVADAQLLFGGGPAGVWRQLDLDTGLLQGVDALDGLTRDELAARSVSSEWAPIPVGGGVILQAQERLRLVPLPEGAPRAFEPMSTINRLGQVVVVLESGLPDRVWVVRSLFGAQGRADGFGATLSGVDGEQLVPEFEVPTLPQQATADGVLFAAGGQVFLATPRGTRSLGVGELHDSNATQAAVLTCDATSECAAEVIEVASGSRRRGPVIAGAATGAYSILLSPGGWVAVTHTDPKFTVSLTDPAGRTSQIGVSDLRADPVWLPGELGLVALTGSALVRFFERDGQIITERVGDIRPGFEEDTLVVVPNA